jgi:hypothetical protein
MKLNQNQSSTQQQISDIVDYYAALEVQSIPGKAMFHSSLKRPNPPTPEAIQRAQFVDKTYVWKGAAPKAQLP